MAPVKKAKGKGKAKPKAKGKKGKDDGAGEEPLTPEEQVALLERQLQTGRLHLLRETERAAAAADEARELRARLAVLEEDFRREEDAKAAMAADMTRQYKGMRAEVLSKVHVLEDRIVQLQDDVEKTRLESVEIERMKDQEIALKDAKIAELSAAMDDMAAEFQEMLKATLDKMSQKIVISNEWGPGEHGKEQPIVTTFEHFDLGLK